MFVGSTRSERGFRTGVVEKIARQVQGEDLPIGIVEGVLTEIISERPKWREVVNLRFSEPAHTLARAAELVGVTRGRVYQIEVECLQRLRSCLVRARVSMMDGGAVLDISIKDFGLGTRSVNGLRYLGVAVVGDLLGLSRLDLYKTPNLGAKSVLEIEVAMMRFGLEFRVEPVVPRPEIRETIELESAAAAPSRPRG